MRNLKKWFLMLKKSKTLIFAFLLSVLGTVQMSLGVFTQYMTPERFGMFSFAIGIVVTVLRFATKSSLDDKIAEALANSEKK